MIKYIKVLKIASDRLKESRLPNYFKSLKASDCEEFLDEEEAFRKMGFTMLDDNAVENVQNQYAAAQYDSSDSDYSHEYSECSDEEH